MTAPLVFALIFLIPTIFLLRGKWFWIIAGYNTSTEAEKRKYDEKKLCRTVGFLMLTMTVGFAVCGTLGYFVQTGQAEPSLLENAKGVFLGVAAAHGLFTLWFARNKCRK
ncbi:MAG: DUF3784 domain-containing protein [Oscillospiraceae bacterium]|nr:DUF3784 domain-containing protein [Oscillospiraceae bacterium]